MRSEVAHILIEQVWKGTSPAEALYRALSEQMSADGQEFDIGDRVYVEMPDGTKKQGEVERISGLAGTANVRGISFPVPWDNIYVGRTPSSSQPSSSQPTAQPRRRLGPRAPRRSSAASAGGAGHGVSQQYFHDELDNAHPSFSVNQVQRTPNGLEADIDDQSGQFDSVTVRLKDDGTYELEYTVQPGQTTTKRWKQKVNSPQDFDQAVTDQDPTHFDDV